jgi:hypothetical protein
MSTYKNELSSALHREYSYYSFGKWLYHPDRVARIKTGAFREVIPVTAQLALTLDCSFECPRCVMVSQRKRRGRLAIMGSVPVAYSGQWSSVGSMTMLRGGHSATVLRDGRV